MPLIRLISVRGSSGFYFPSVRITSEYFCVRDVCHAYMQSSLCDAVNLAPGHITAHNSERGDTSMVEHSSEKAGGGSIPSLATTFSITYTLTFALICSISFQNPIRACGKLDSTRSGSDGFCPRLALRMVKTPPRPDRSAALAIMLCRSSCCMPNDHSRPRAYP